MKISKEKPACFEKLQKAFGINWEKGIIITYGDTVYTSNPRNLTPDLIIHEEVHIRQQARMNDGKDSMFKDEWVDRFISDPVFRLEQEIEAYRAQLGYIQQNYNRKLRRFLESKIVHDMVHSYENMCTADQARRLLNL